MEDYFVDNYGFRNIVGYDDIKEELVRILYWYKQRNKIIDKDINLPKGIVFCGASGCGKTSLMQDYAAMFNYPIFNLRGKNINIIEEISNIFVFAKKEENAVIIINDLDLLLYDNSNVLRLLIQELDDINNNNCIGNIIVLASANEIDEDSFLFRNGRFDRVFKLGFPKRLDIGRIINFYLNRFEITLEENALEYLTNILSGCSGADIKCIIEDAYLSSTGKVSLEDIENSWYLIYEYQYDRACHR